MYPKLNVTKSQVIDYYATVGSQVIAQTTGTTRDPDPFPRDRVAVLLREERTGRDARVDPRDGGQFHPLPGVQRSGAVVWSAQINALELHTRSGANRAAATGWSWTSTRVREQGSNDAAEVAPLVGDYLAADGLSGTPVTSGSKGMQLYVPFPEPMDGEAVLNYARSMAAELATAHPQAIVATMTKSKREQRVFIDWSQNNPAKTTITPYRCARQGSALRRHTGDLGRGPRRADRAVPLHRDDGPGAGVRRPDAGLSRAIPRLRRCWRSVHRLRRCWR